MLTDDQKEKYSSLKVEVIDMNILTHFFIRKINRIGYLFQKTTRHHILEEFTALRYMENGLISLGLVPRCLQRVKKRFLRDTPSACSGEFHYPNNQLINSIIFG